MKMIKSIISLVDDELFNAHFMVVFIVLMLGLLNDATDIQTSFLGLYCICSIILQAIPFVFYFMFMIVMNIKVYIFFCKNRKEVDKLFYNRNFTEKQWIEYLSKGNFTEYQSRFLLKMFINRNVFVRQGNYYRYIEQDWEY
jgi:Ni,Fe-hydrogenase I cytochrome b subunit